MNNRFDFFIFLDLLCLSLINAEPLVQIYQGILNGTIQKSRNGRKFAAFYAIPYAEPPIKNLRFANAVPAGNWEGILPANSFGNICPQIRGRIVLGNEDCLLLNVFTPLLKFNSSKRILLPILVYIHGGSYIGGSSNMYGPGYLLDKNVLLVTINYRLGIFGYLTTGDASASGNFGMKDQVLALKWIQQNIKLFGGDPSKITLFGESAGGGSVSLHTISKLSRSLFQQAIIQSSGALCPWIFQKRNNLIKSVNNLAPLVLCPLNTSESFVDCLRGKSVDTLINTDSIFNALSSRLLLTWRPVDEPEAEDAFLTDSPKNLIKKNQIKDLPFMSGAVTEEALIVTIAPYLNDQVYNIVRSSVKSLITYIADFYIDSEKEEEFIAAVDKFYFNNTLASANKSEFLKGLPNFISDGYLLYPAQRTLEKVTPKIKNSNYLYLFGYRGAISLYSAIENNRKDIGVGHEDEILYLFQINLGAIQYSELNFTITDISVSKIMVDLWTEFATHGKPISDKLINPNLWKPYNTQENTHLQIGNIKINTDPTIDLSKTFYTSRMEFWRKNAPI